LPSSCAGDDVASISYVIKRRLMNASLNLPEVMLIDGGILQLNSVKNSLNQLGFHDKIKVIALSKGEHRKPELDNLIVNPTTKLAYSSNREIFRLVQGLRDEAHRFAITGHRKQQVKRMQGSVLDEITGIGKAKRQALLAFFGSTAGIAQADINQLRQVKGVGLNLAKQIYQFFHK
jgi:excinuclease ABC subunit C